ncbi:MAG: hypothetical protein FJ388_03430 [Verrucomicrobia bacterium]|nr:hypothetical protein [Verrucomicrobiota bacterium]
MKNITTLTVSLLIGTAAALAGDVQPLMVQRGACLLDESFAGSLDTNKWKVAIGAWQVENGSLAGTERPSDHHAAVIKTPFTNITAVVQFSFMLKGDSCFHFSVNDPGGHNSRITVRANSIVMRKDLDKKDPRSYAPVLDETGASLAPDKWHTMIVELNGAEMLARVDDALFLYGSHPGINKEKRDFGFPVIGAALFDNVKIWSATANSDWPAEKAKLLARQAERPAIDRSANPTEAFQVAEGKVRDRLMKSDAKFVALVDARAAVQEAIAKAFPVVKRRGPKADAEKKRLASEDAKYKKLAADLRLALKNERDYLFAQAPEVKKAWEAFAAANQAKAKAKAAGKK